MDNRNADCGRISSLEVEGGGEMSVDISRFVDTALKEKTTLYSPVIEAIVNSIEAIRETKRQDGKIIIKPIRNTQISMDTEASPDIVGFIVEDNGIGFNMKNRDAFDTLFTDYKVEMGGMGVGRFIFLKYFRNAKFSSIYKDNGKYRKREFTLGSKTDIIEREIDNEIEASDTLTVLTLDGLRQQGYDKGLDTIAKKLLERILVFFVDDRFQCPTIILREKNSEIILNNLIGSDEDIQPIHIEQFSLSGFKTPEGKQRPIRFLTKIYKIIYPGGLTSKLCLTAHGRVVTETSISKYIPEFKDDFVDKDDETTRNYRIVAYTIGNYLDNNVTFERGRFNFPTEEGADILYPLSQQIIEKHSANIVEKILKNQVYTRRQKRIDAFRKYVDESAPWYKPYLKELDLSVVPGDLDEQAMEAILQGIKFKKEKKAKAELEKIIDNPTSELFAKTNELVKHIQEAGSSDLTHYVALRKIVLELLKKLLEIDDGKYNKEADIHNIIFPMKSDSETISYEEQNLWILDEKLNFTELVSSDKATDKGHENRPDLLIFNNKMVYRSGNEKSNPITIFEFKQPQRDDFANQSSEEDPIDQILRYAREIKDGKYKTPEGRDIYVDDNTPFYGYVICDFTQKVIDWLYGRKEFTPMPDGLGYFRWFSNNKLYMEVLAWDKILKDAETRNKIFFKKLGLV